MTELEELAFTIAADAPILLVLFVVAAVVFAVGVAGVFYAFLGRHRDANAVEPVPCASCDGRYLDDAEFRAIGEAAGVVSRG